MVRMDLFSLTVRVAVTAVMTDGARGPCDVDSIAGMVGA